MSQGRLQAAVRSSRSKHLAQNVFSHVDTIPRTDLTDRQGKDRECIDAPARTMVSEKKTEKLEDIRNDETKNKKHEPKVSRVGPGNRVGVPERVWLTFLNAPERVLLTFTYVPDRGS